MFKPPTICKYVGSSKYAPLAALPSQLLPPLPLPAHAVYRPRAREPPPRSEPAPPGLAPAARDNRDTKSGQCDLKLDYPGTIMNARDSPSELPKATLLEKTGTISSPLLYNGTGHAAPF